jgi:hypothetical protein
MGRLTHDYPLSFEEAKGRGLPVKSGLPEEVYQLMAPFPQATRQRPFVQYIPIPYKEAIRRGKKSNPWEGGNGS